MTQPETPAPPPEAVAIRRAREARGLSPEQAAPLMQTKLSGARWRQIEQGYEVKGGVRVPIRGRDMVIAHMAAVVGLHPKALKEADRPEAAEILRQITTDRPAEGPKYDDPGLQAIWEAPALTEMERRLAIGAVQAWRSQEGDAGTGRPSRRADIA